MTKYCGTWASAIIIGLFYIYYSWKSHLRPLEISRDTKREQQFPLPLFSAENLEFRYAWHKINRLMRAFQPFFYLIEPEVCTEKKNATMVLYVAIKPDKNGLSTRNLIRKTWAAIAKFYEIEVVFSMGVSKATEKSYQDITSIIEESKQFRDILLANFVDSWENLILKWWSNNYYHSSCCSQISLMASMDSDAVVFAEHFEKLAKYSSYIFNGYLGCRVISGQPVERDNRSRYYVSELQWPGSELPAYCSGVLIIEDAQSCKKISDVIPQLGIRYIAGIRIFDVLTGAIAQAVGLKLQDIPEIEAWLPLDDVCHLVFIHGIHSDILVTFLKYRQHCCNGNNGHNECPFNGTINMDELRSVTYQDDVFQDS